jgi:hypothetical protein
MTPLLRRATLLVLNILLSSAGCLAAEPNARPMILEHLSTLDGLPQGTILASLHDSQGFVWFGTEDGLVRYDGHEIYRYAYSPKVQGGLPGNFIFAIAEDEHADLWLAIKGAGLARWNRASDTFTVFKHDDKQPAVDRQRHSADFDRRFARPHLDRVRSIQGSTCSTRAPAPWRICARVPTLRRH